MLFVSVWEIQNRVIKSEKFVAGSKYFCFILPAFQVILTNLDPVVNIPTLHLIFGNCISELYHSIFESPNIHFTNVYA